MVLVFAGPNGSGKSTITEYFEIVGRYTNADDMVRTSFISNEEAAIKLMNSDMSLSVKKKISHLRLFCLQSTRFAYKIRILRAAKEAGYFIKCVFVLTASADLNVARVRSRASLGGHDVDPGKVRERYRKSLSNISVLMEICDILHVYDNTNSKPVRIVRKHKDDITIYPNKDWSEAVLLSLING